MQIPLYFSYCNWSCVIPNWPITLAIHWIALQPATHLYFSLKMSENASLIFLLYTQKNCMAKINKLRIIIKIVTPIWKYNYYKMVSCVYSVIGRVTISLVKCWPFYYYVGQFKSIFFCVYCNFPFEDSPKFFEWLLVGCPKRFATQ